jgi:hypothetical protein
MGAYVYRITAKKVQTPVGPANVMKYAYKPFNGFGDDVMKRNSKMERQSGCYAAQGMINRGSHTGLAASMNTDGTVARVYRTGDLATFSDYQLDCMKTVWQLSRR